MILLLAIDRPSFNVKVMIMASQIRGSVFAKNPLQDFSTGHSQRFKTFILKYLKVIILVTTLQYELALQMLLH